MKIRKLRKIKQRSMQRVAMLNTLIAASDWRPWQDMRECSIKLAADFTEIIGTLDFLNKALGEIRSRAATTA